VATGRGEGYFDSLTGLLFFLLCGRLFQQQTYHRLAFDRDYKAFFPLSVTRVSKHAPGSAEQTSFSPRREERVSLSQLAPGDHLLIRHAELVPADARLVSGSGGIDSSFVTGESEEVDKTRGDHLYAGGRQMGGTIEVEMLKPVSQSYLATLWNQEAFRKEKPAGLVTVTNRYSQRFTLIVLAMALGAAVFWAPHDPSRALKAFISVLIVACPCALALAAPFGLGTAQRVLARRRVYLKSPEILERLSTIDTVVLDKTGTLTSAETSSARFAGPALTEDEARWVHGVARHSTHPHCLRLSRLLSPGKVEELVLGFQEMPGSGAEGKVAGHEVWLGSASWLGSKRLRVPKPAGGSGSAVHLAIDRQYRGSFSLAHGLRPEIEAMLHSLSPRYALALLSGDQERERERFQALFRDSATLRFNQSPLDKLQHIRRLQASGHHVMMVGDGLNDAGALKQSDVGVAVVENASAFSPASDAIMSADEISRLHHVLRFARSSVGVVRASFLISTLYNVAGISIAAAGLLSPVVCAVLMPLSSITVVGFASGLTTWFGRPARFGERAPLPPHADGLPEGVVS
jgi:Cu+-exporting ATPase